jgi:hypothetical protein
MREILSTIQDSISHKTTTPRGASLLTTCDDSCFRFELFRRASTVRQNLFQRYAGAGLGNSAEVLPVTQ